MVNDIKKQFRKRGLELPLRKKSDCVYLLGYPGTDCRKLHLHVIGGDLKSM